jgi:regulator of replication initiation timing
MKPNRGTEKSTKTLEELQMENDALRQLSDTLSKRLHMWEVNAQSSSMALQQSLKAMHQHNTASPTASSAIPPSHVLAPTTVDSDRRIKELEDLVRRSEKETDRFARENEKLKGTLGRYRERWEKLKEGAKTRRSAEAAAGANSPAGLGTPLQKPDDEFPATPVDTPKLGDDGSET